MTGTRNVFVMSAAVFALIAGEQLWTRFLPVYLVTLGAPAVALGLWGSSKDFLDAVLQYPGGALSDRYGSQRALLLFTAIAGLGYLAFWLAPSWEWMFVGLVFATAWGSLASPAMFALVAESLPPGRRARGFLIQSVLRRVPIVFAPTLGGMLVEGMGLRDGLRMGFSISIMLAIVTLWFQNKYYLPPAHPPAPRTHGLAALWRRAPAPLRRLLVADVLARAAESMADVFVVVYVLDHLHAGPMRYGGWIGLQMAVSIASYFPGAWLADRFGPRLPVAITFAMFAASPLMVALASGYASLTLAFVVAGLRELGEPARKAMIVDAAPADARAQTVGAYYLARSVLIIPAGIAGGLLWLRHPEMPFWMAGAIGAVGVVYFLILFRHARPASLAGA
ncbi:MAG: MFS transporter [Candidatus Eiseniibacteriota bacterium]